MKLAYQLTYERHLPHIQPAGATLFVTFRLAGSLPQTTRDQLREEAERAQTALAGIADEPDYKQRQYKEQKRLFGRWDATLDQATNGPDWLRQQHIATLVSKALKYRNGLVYALDCYCIMPNHVHVVFTPLQKEDGTFHALSRIMHSLKRHTAREANKLLGRQGPFWQHESYDHYVRDDGELCRIRQYVINNPVKAGLADHWQAWPWTHVT